MGHVWRYGDQICGEAALKLIERDRGLVADFDATQDVEIAWVKAELLHAEMRRAAAFWLGTPEVSGG
jgi:hypothetical protein